MTTKLGKITLPESVAKRLPTQISDRIADIKFPDVKFPEVKFSEVKFPEVKLSGVKLPESARGPISATVGAAEVAVDRVRDAVSSAQGQVVKTQKSITDKASTVVVDTAATASTAYADLSKRGAAVIHRVWPDSADAEVTEIKEATKKPAARKPAAKKPAARKPVMKKPATKPAAKAAPKPAAKAAAPAAPKPAAKAAPKAATTPEAPAAPVAKATTES